MEKAQQQSDQPGQASRYAVSASQPIRQQIGRLWRLLKGHPTVVVTGLGQALTHVVDIVEMLNKKDLVTINSIRTSSISHPEKRLKTPQLEITIALKHLRILSEDRQKQLKSLFKTLSTSKSGRVSVTDLTTLDLSKAIEATPEADKAYAINWLMVLDSYSEGHVDGKDWLAYVAALCPEGMQDEQFANVVKYIENKIHIKA